MKYDNLRLKIRQLQTGGTIDFANDIRLNSWSTQERLMVKALLNLIQNGLANDAQKQQYLSILSGLEEGKSPSLLGLGPGQSYKPESQTTIDTGTPGANIKTDDGTDAGVDTTPTSPFDISKINSVHGRSNRRKEAIELVAAAGYDPTDAGEGTQKVTDLLRGAKDTRIANFKDNAANALMGMTGASTPMGAVGSIVTGTIDAVDNAVLGDKNFGALSEAIDQGVDMASNALMSSGNPYAIAAAMALKGANFLTKAGGNTVPGFDVEINSSGYDLNLGHYEEKSTRNWAGMLGLGISTDSKKVQRMLDKRNEAVELAASAAQISNQLKFIQEARNNSVEDVLAQNQAVLNGGTTTDLLGA